MGDKKRFPNIVDEMKSYNRALIATVVAAFATAGSAGKCAEPDGTPCIYVNGILAEQNPFIVLSDDAPQVELLSTDLNTTLWYSLDDIPPLGGFLYAGPFHLPDIAHVQAIAVGTNGSFSQITYRSILRFPADFVAANHLAIALRDASGVSFILRGTANYRYVLERSTDMFHWTPIFSTIAPLDGVARMKDSNPPAGQAFYRAVGE